MFTGCDGSADYTEGVVAKGPDLKAAKGPDLKFANGPDLKVANGPDL